MWFDFEARPCQAGTPIPLPPAPEDFAWIVRGVYVVQDYADELQDDFGAGGNSVGVPASEGIIALRIDLDQPTILRVVGFLRRVKWRAARR